jgi:hypothetical protein
MARRVNAAKPLPAPPSRQRWAKMTTSERDNAAAPYLPMLDWVQMKEREQLMALGREIGIGDISKKADAVYAILSELVHEDHDHWTAKQRRNAEKRAHAAVVRVFKLLLPHMIARAKNRAAAREATSRRVNDTEAAVKSEMPNATATSRLLVVAERLRMSPRTVERRRQKKGSR